MATAAASSATSSNGSERPLFSGEPAGPTVKSQIPGPNAIKAVEKLSKVFDTQNVNMMVNYNESQGN